jgi:hypothetical protein
MLSRSILPTSWRTRAAPPSACAAERTADDGSSVAGSARSVFCGLTRDVRPDIAHANLISMHARAGQAASRPPSTPIGGICALP